MGGVHEVDLTLALAGLLQARLPLVPHEDRLLAGVLLDRLLGRDRDRPRFAPTQSQPVLEEVADLAEAPADPGLLLDDRLSLLGGADRVLPEGFLQGVLVLSQDASGLMPRTATHARQATFQVLVEVYRRRSSTSCSVV